MKRVQASRRRRATRRAFLTFEWLLIIALFLTAIVIGFAAVRCAFISYLAPIPHRICAIDVECTPCDPASCPPDQCNCGRQPWYCETCNGP